MGRKPQDLTGRQFGLLTAMYPTEQRDKRGSVYWHCVCECGNTIDVPAAGLIHAHNRSCGCLKDQNQKAIADRRHLVDGTCVEVLEKRKKRRDNESGFRGVFRLKNSIDTVSISVSRESVIMLVSLMITTKQSRPGLKRRT